MATIQSTKPGEIAGSSVLTGRTPSYRLVLKVDPQTGQYKYEYEVDDKPKAIDAVAPPPQAASTKVADPAKDVKKEVAPVQTFEQTQKMLSGGSRGSEDRGSYRDRFGTAEDQGYGYSGTPGKGGSGTFQNPKFGKTGDTFTPGPGIGKAYDEYGILRDIGVMNDIGLNLYDKAYPVAKAAKDYVSTGGIVGAIKGIADSLTGKKDTSKTTSGQGAASDIPAEDRFKSFEQTTDALGGTANLGSTRGVFSDLTAARENIDSQIEQLEEDNKSPFAPRTFNENKIKDLQEQKESLGQRLSTQATQDAEIQDVTEQLRDLGLKFRGQPVNVAKFEIDNKQAKNALTAQGLLHTGQTFAEAQVEVKADIAKKAAAAERAKKELAARQAREEAARAVAAAARAVDRNNAVSNVARSNEVADKNGNAVTYTDRVTGQQKAVNWSGGSGYNVSPAKGARLTRSEVRQRKAQIDRQKERKQPGGRDRQRQRDRREGRRARGGQGGKNKGTSRF